MAIIKCANCDGTNVATKAWVKYECDQFVVSDFCEEGWMCWDCEKEIDVVVEEAA